MKFKYFLRGLGVGILFCTLIVFAAYQTSPNKLLTDEEVKARAKELGMVEAETELDKVLQGKTDTEEAETGSATENTTGQPKGTEEGNVTKQPKATEENSRAEQPKTAEGTTTEQTKTTEKGSTEDSARAPQGTTTEQTKTTEKGSTEDSARAPQGTTAEQTKTTEKGSTEDSARAPQGTTTEQTGTSGEDDVTTATITVTRGMQSSTVAKELEKKGIIKSASDFDSYLNKKGYSTKICVGTYSVKSSDSYETLAKILMKQK